MDMCMLGDLCILDGHVHAWSMGTCLVVGAYVLEECMFDENVHDWWMTACMMDMCMFRVWVHI